MRYIIFLLTSIVLFDSCREAVTKNKIQPVKVTVVDTMMVARQKYFAETASQLNLKPFDNSVDSFEIRIWISSVFIEQDLVVLRCTNANWQSQRFRFIQRQDGVIDFKRYNSKVHGISLEMLVDSLRQIKFEGLLSQKQIPGFVDNVADGAYYSIEVTTKDNYKQLVYHCPELFAKSEINNKKFLDLLLLMNSYFHFYFPICSSGGK